MIKEQESGLQIMSIHKSKGLEFPIVIVGNTASKGKGGGIISVPSSISRFLTISLIPITFLQPRGRWFVMQEHFLPVVKNKIWR